MSQVFEVYLPPAIISGVGIFLIPWEKSVDDPSEYLIYSEWESLDAFRNFVTSEAYKNTVNYGKTIIEGRPHHKVFQEVNA